MGDKPYALMSAAERYARKSRGWQRMRLAMMATQRICWLCGFEITEARDYTVDHVVPLAEAWRSGAWSWSSARRKSYANDLGAGWTLRAVTDNVNQSKGDGDPSDWMPPYAPATCRYLADWVSVKIRWKLSINTAERSSILTSWSRQRCDRATAPLTIEVRLAP